MQRGEQLDDLEQIAALALVRAIDPTELTTRLGRAPTVAELGIELGCGEEQVLEALGALASRHAAPLPMGDEPTDGRPTPLAESDPGFADVTVRLALGPALASLDVRERRLIELRFVQDLSQSEIATRLGMSQMHVSRLLRRALTRLEDQLQRDELAY